MTSKDRLRDEIILDLTKAETEALLRYRKRAGMSMERLAHQVGRTKEWLRQHEGGETDGLKTGDVHRLADTLADAILGSELRPASSVSPFRGLVVRPLYIPRSAALEAVAA